MIDIIKIREDLDHRITRPFLGVLNKGPLTPNALTITGLVINIVAAYAIATGHFIYGGLLILLSGLFDLLDGALARYSNQASRFGAILDSTVDRVSEAAIFMGLLLYFWKLGTQQEIIVIFLVLVGSFLVSYIRARSEGQGLECKVGWFTRAERIIVIALGLLLNQVGIAMWILLVFIYVTVLQRLLYIRKQARMGRV
jgi:CDP-diacylglycerol--glycerol-3-phosphate 3-phosphatidyltransferase